MPGAFALRCFYDSIEKLCLALFQESKLTLNYFVIAFMRRDVFVVRGCRTSRLICATKPTTSCRAGRYAPPPPPPPTTPPPYYITLTFYRSRCGNPKLIGHVPCARGWASIRCDCFVSITKCITTLPHDK